jgi:hypothetical protein
MQLFKKYCTAFCSMKNRKKGPGMNSKEATIAFVVITVLLTLFNLVMPKIFGQDEGGAATSLERRGR